MSVLFFENEFIDSFSLIASTTQPTLPDIDRRLTMMRVRAASGPTLIWREVPRSEYTKAGIAAPYSPLATGRFASDVA